MSKPTSPADDMMSELRTSFDTIIQKFAASTHSVSSDQIVIDFEVSPIGLGQLYFEFNIGVALRRKTDDDEHKEACTSNLKLL